MKKYTEGWVEFHKKVSICFVVFFPNLDLFLIEYLKRMLKGQ